MANVFNYDGSNTFKTKASKAIIKIGGDTYMALNVQIQFQRNVEILDTISEGRIVSIGEPKGTFSAERVYGNSNAELFKNGCDDTTIEITSKDDCSGGPLGGTIKCGGVTLSSVSLTLQGGRGFIAQGVQGVFTTLDLTPNG